MPYIIYVYALGVDPAQGEPLEILGPFPREESVSRRFSHLVAQEAETGSLQREFRIVEIGMDEARALIKARSGTEEPATDDDSHSELPSELLTLLQLDPHGDGTVSAELAADVCGRDRDRILRFIRICEEQSIEWREAGRDASVKADVGDAEASFHESAAWDKTTSLLRAALRVVVENPPESSSTS